MKWLYKYTLILGGLFLATYIPRIIVAISASPNQACYGTTSNGYLQGASIVKTSTILEGPSTYCWFCKQALRQYADERVAQAIGYAYNDKIVYEYPNSFMIGEVGFPWGGKFRPHKTHQNGMSIDIMVPLTTGALPTNIFNKYGYALDFDQKGRGEVGQINFKAIDASLLALQEYANTQGGRIQRVFFAPDLQKHLSAKVRSKFQFNTKQSWVRHDDHYHVDFGFPCL